MAHNVIPLSGRRKTSLKWQEWLDTVLYPRLYERLPDAFPEFGWEHRGDCYVATRWLVEFPLDCATKDPGRLYVYDNACFCIKVHGRAGVVRLLDLANGGVKPTGADMASFT